MLASEKDTRQGGPVCGQKLLPTWQPARCPSLRGAGQEGLNGSAKAFGLGKCMFIHSLNTCLPSASPGLVTNGRRCVDPALNEPDLVLPSRSRRCTAPSVRSKAPVHGTWGRMAVHRREHTSSAGTRCRMCSGHVMGQGRRNAA